MENERLRQGQAAALPVTGPWARWCSFTRFTEFIYFQVPKVASSTDWFLECARIDRIENFLYLQTHEEVSAGYRLYPGNLDLESLILQHV